MDRNRDAKWTQLRSGSKDSISPPGTVCDFSNFASGGGSSDSSTSASDTQTGSQSKETGAGTGSGLRMNGMSVARALVVGLGSVLSFVGSVL